MQAETGNDPIKSLIKAAQNGDRSAQNELVASNSALVWSIVKRFYGRGVEAEDLYQTGCIGLLKAIMNFDESFGVKFSTYAVPMIIGEIRRFIRDDGIIKVSRSIKENAQKAHAAMRSLQNELGRDATISELAERTGLDEDELALSLEATAQPSSIYQPVGDSSNLLLIDRIMSVDSGEEEILNSMALKEVLSTFGAREQKIIILRYFKNKTQTEIAELLGISQVQVSRLEKKILLELKEKLK